MSSFSINHIPNTAYIRLLDVGQGDTIHLHDSRCDILIDTGNVDNYNRVVNYFIKSNIQSIDYLILSHNHDDHIGETVDLISNLQVDTVIANRFSLVDSRTKIMKPVQNVSFSCGDYHLKVIHSDDFHTEENNNSIILTVEIYQHKWLFTGDMEAFIENQLNSQDILDIDVIKVPHHGSITSSSMSLINQINPRYALISVGKNNKYGHPDSRILERWESINSNVLRTDLHGTIEFLYVNSGNEALVTTSLVEEIPYYYLKRIIPFLDWLLNSLFSML